MRLSLYFCSFTLVAGCSVYDQALLNEAIGQDPSAIPGDGDEMGIGDGDDGTGDGTGGTGEGSGGSGSSDATGGLGGDVGGGGTPVGTGGGTGGTGTGGTGTGGTGTGGTGTGGAPVGIESMLDDFTAPAAYINSIDGRFGPWAVYNDQTPDQIMVPGPGMPFTTEARPEDPSNQALHVTATGFTSWGAGLFVSLNNTAGPMAYDMEARSYDAIRLWAKVGSPTAHTDLRLNLADTHSTTAGTCADPCAQDHLRGQLFLTTEWTEYTILLSDLHRQVLPTPPDFSAVYEFHLNMDSDDIDFWVDDIRFVDLP